MRTESYAYVHYRDIEDIFADDFAGHVSGSLHGEFTWLGSLNRNGQSSDGNLLVRMERDHSPTECSNLLSLGKKEFAVEVEFEPGGDRIQLAEWLACKQRFLVSGEDVQLFG